MIDAARRALPACLLACWGCWNTRVVAVGSGSFSSIAVRSTEDAVRLARASSVENANIRAIVHGQVFVDTTIQVWGAARLHVSGEGSDAALLASPRSRRLLDSDSAGESAPRAASESAIGSTGTVPVDHAVGCMFEVFGDASLRVEDIKIARAGPDIPQTTGPLLTVRSGGLVEVERCAFSSCAAVEGRSDPGEQQGRGATLIPSIMEISGGQVNIVDSQLSHRPLHDLNQSLDAGMMLGPLADRAERLTSGECKGSMPFLTVIDGGSVWSVGTTYNGALDRTLRRPRIFLSAPGEARPADLEFRHSETIPALARVASHGVSGSAIMMEEGSHFSAPDGLAMLEAARELVAQGQARIAQEDARVLRGPAIPQTLVDKDVMKDDGQGVASPWAPVQSIAVPALSAPNGKKRWRVSATSGHSIQAYGTLEGAGKGVGMDSSSKDVRVLAYPGMRSELRREPVQPPSRKRSTARDASGAAVVDIQARHEQIDRRQNLRGQAVWRQMQDCAEGYDGASCVDCAEGYYMDADGKCESTSDGCSSAAMAHAVVLWILGLILLIFTLDAAHSGTSPPRRISKIRESAVRICGGNAAWSWCTSDRASAKTAIASRADACGRGRGCAWWDREGLARFAQGCMVYVVTGQIVTQGNEVLELQLPLAMERVITGLEWTNITPFSVAAACTTDESMPFFDRAIGTVGLLTAWLALLLLSHVTVALCGCGAQASRERKHNSADRSSNSGHGYLGSGDGCSNSRNDEATPNTRQDCHFIRGNGNAYLRSATQSGAGQEQRMTMAAREGAGAWARWAAWQSCERHACAAVSACLLVHPVVCTMLLRIFDCQELEGEEGAWMRADLRVECFVDEHEMYQVVAAMFLGLYGIGIPLAFFTMVYWAKQSVDQDGIELGEDTTLATGGRPPRSGSPGVSQRFASAAEIVADEDAFVGGMRPSIGASQERRRVPQPEARSLQRKATVPSPSRDRSPSRSPGTAQRSERSLSRMHGGTGDGDGGSRIEQGNPGNPYPMDRRMAAGHVNPHVEDGTERKRSSATTISDSTGRGGCMRWVRTSSRQCVLGVGESISSHPRLWMSSMAGGDKQLGKRWRSTIPIWSPYRSERLWFAAWELGRRSLLTGGLSLVPFGDNEEGYWRVAIACAIAVLSLLVAEVARPYRDPWIGWAYRMGGFFVLLVNFLGLLEQAQWAGEGSSVAILVAVVALFLLLALLVCVCCGWRLSCAQQHEHESTNALVLADQGMPCGFQGPATGSRSTSVRTGSAHAGSDGDRAAVYAASSDRDLPRESCGVSEQERSLSGGSVRVRELSSSTDVDGASRPSKRSPARRQFLGSGSDRDSSLTPSKRNHARQTPDRQPDADTSSRDSERLTYTQNPLYGNNACPVDISGVGDVGGEALASSDGGATAAPAVVAVPARLGGRRMSAFDRYMLSRSPTTTSGNPVVKSAFAFNSVSGEGSSSIVASIEAHKTASGRAFHSHHEPSQPVRVISLSDLAVSPRALKPNPLGSPARSPGGGGEKEDSLDSASDHDVDPLALRTAGPATEVRGHVPMLAPGAPRIEGHRPRFAARGGPNRSSSSFASTSFESTTTGTGGRSRKSSASTTASRAKWRWSTGSNALTSKSGSQSRDLGWNASFGASNFSGGSGSVHEAIAAADSRAVPGNGAVSTTRSNARVLTRLSTGASSSFMSSGSSSVSSWVSSAFGLPPLLRPLHSKASQDDSDIRGSGVHTDHEESTTNSLGNAWTSTRSGRGGWPLNLQMTAAAPAWWAKRSSHEDANAVEDKDMAVAAPPDLVAAAAERAAAAEQEAAVARVEAVFGHDSQRKERLFSNADGGSNIPEFRAFVRAGGSGTSSFDSRTSDGTMGSSVREDCASVEGDGDGPGFREGEESDVTTEGLTSTSNPRNKRGAGNDASFRHDRPLSSGELKQQFDFDFEDEGDLDEDPVSFVRVADRVNIINAKVAEGGKRSGKASTEL